MKKLLTILFTLLLYGCSQETLADTVSELGTTPVEILESVANQYGTERDYSVWVFDHEARFSTDDEEYVINLEDELFYVSIAPYIDNTHT